MKDLIEMSFGELCEYCLIISEKLNPIIVMYEKAKERHEAKLRDLNMEIIYNLYKKIWHYIGFLGIQVYFCA